MANAYLYLIEQMHFALNSEGESNCENDKNTNTKNAYFYAEEFHEMANITEAKKIYVSVSKSSCHLIFMRLIFLISILMNVS